MAKEAMTAKRTPATRVALTHRALFFRVEEEYVARIASFVRAGLTTGQPTLLAVPAARAGPLRTELGPDASRVRFTDMAVIGRNPAWLIPQLQEFIEEHRGQAVRYVGEPIWAGRTDAQICEATRHEALINLMLAQSSLTILCPYDASRLAPAVIADARLTHPLLVQNDGDGGTVPSTVYSPVFRLPGSCESPLPPPPVSSLMTLTFSTDLSAVRDLVRQHAVEAGLGDARVVDLVLAVSEVAANTLRHAKSAGTLQIWHDADEIICQIQDKGRITDPLAGRRRPAADAMGGHGLWLVNQVCDLVEMRSDETGTTIRLHMALPSS
jgi:anti-sigma regulatory factor (Ser/Thr protein kinase)